MLAPEKNLSREGLHLTYETFQRQVLLPMLAQEPPGARAHIHTHSYAHIHTQNHTHKQTVSHTHTHTTHTHE